MIHPILGAVNPSRPGFWDADASFAGRAVTVDLTIDGDAISESVIESLPQTLSDLAPLDRAARAAILRDAQSGDDDAAAVLYVTHHYDVLDAATFHRLFGAPSPDTTNPCAALSRLVLVRVGMYPEHDDARVLLDYSIDPDASDYLLSVSFNARGQPTAVDLES